MKRSIYAYLGDYQPVWDPLLIRIDMGEIAITYPVAGNGYRPGPSPTQLRYNAAPICYHGSGPEMGPSSRREQS